MEKHVPCHQAAVILRLEIIDVGAVAVNFFVNRVAGTVQEILSVARLGDGLPRFFIDLPAVKNFTGRITFLCRLDRCIASIAHDIENLLMFRRTSSPIKKVQVMSS